MPGKETYMEFKSDEKKTWLEDENGKQIAFGRTVTDYATMFYVSDVVVDKDHQKHGNKDRR